MKQAWTVLLATMMLAGIPLGQSAVAADGDTAKAMTDLAAKTRSALGVVQFTVEDELAGTQKPAGMAICVGVKDDKATLITTALPTTVLPGTVKKVEVMVPGVEKPLAALYSATDPESGISFVTVTDPYKWQTVTFAEKADLSVGKQVFSVGLLDQWLGFEPYLGMGYVSARLRVPGPMAYVTGGNLTNIGSPVFSADGVAIGIVLQQLPNAVTLASEGGRGSVLLTSQRENSCFIPVEDFANVLKNPPAPGKRMTWIGIRFGKYAEDVVPLHMPAVKADKVYADSPAAKAGIKDGETIVALNDQPIEKLATPDLMVQNFTRLISRLPAGTKISLTLHRVPKDEKVDVTSEAIPTTPGEAKKYISQSLGFVVRNKVPLDAALDMSATAKEVGVYLMGVAQKSPAETAGLKAGNEFTLIVSVNGKPVKDVDEFKKFVEEAPTKPVNLLVQKGDHRETVTIAPNAPK